MRCGVLGLLLLACGCGSGTDSCPSDLHKSIDFEGGRCLASCATDADCEGGQTCSLITTSTGFCAEPTASSGDNA